MSALLVALLGGLLAQAGVVSAPPRGAPELGLLLCAGDGCNDRLFWLSLDPSLSSLPVVVVETVLVDELAWSQDREAEARWQAALDEARLALVEGRLPPAQAALDRAGEALSRLAGDPPNEELVAWAFLQGALALEQGQASRAEERFAQAAALAWNRSLRLPEGCARWEEPLYAAMAALLRRGPGELLVEDGDNGLSFTLDGVPLGPAPLRVSLLPGEHRLSGGDARQAHAWSQTVRVQAGQRSTVRALLANDDDARHVTYQLAMAVESGQLDPDVAALLERWAARHELRRLRLLRLDADAQAPIDDIAREAGGALPRFRVRQVLYEPSLRRISALP